jgi:hypothetical protein
VCRNLSMLQMLGMQVRKLQMLQVLLLYSAQQFLKVHNYSYESQYELLRI